jgi:6-phosphogluconolactonase
LSLRFDIHADKAAVAEAAAALLAATAEAGGQIALSGGSTVGAAYELAARADWRQAVVWWGDERCVPPDDERSNYLLAKRTLLDRVAETPQVHRIAGELPPEAAAEAYDAELEGVAIDLAFNGIGPDGHTASLFPGSPQLDAGDRRVVSGPAGLEPFVDRVTLTLAMLNAARTVAFVVTGADKAEAVRRAFCLEPSRDTPASLVRGTAETIAILDREAASLLDIRRPPG